MGKKQLLHLVLLLSFLLLNSAIANPETIAQNFDKFSLVSGDSISPEIYVPKVDRVFIEGETISNIRIHLNAFNLLKSSIYPQSIKIDLYKLSGSDKKPLSITTKTITNLKEAKNLNLKLAVGTLSESTDIYLDLYDTSGLKIGTYKTFIQVDSMPISQEIALANASCAGAAFGECQLNYLLNNIKFEVIPKSSLATSAKKQFDGTYTVSIPILNSKNRVQTKKNGSGSIQSLIDSSIINFVDESDEMQASLFWNSLSSKLELSFKDSLEKALTIDRQGRINIGTQDDNAYLSIRASDEQNASLKLNAGTLTTTPINGALEFDGSKLYFTSSGTRTELGARGPQGLQGPQGPIGSMGLQGPQGPAGATGPAGSGLSAGSIISNIILNGTTLFNSSNIAQFNGEILIPDGASNGYVLTSDANGSASWQAAVGGGGDATTIDSIDSLSFLRSDTTDNFTSGVLILNSGTRLDVNGDLSIADTNISLDGASTTFTQTTGAININPATRVGIKKAVATTTLDVNGTLFANTVNGTSANFTNLISTNIAGSGALITALNGSRLSSGIVSAVYGGTGVSNSGTVTFGANDISFAGDDIALTATGPTSLTLPTSGTLSTLAGTETLRNKTLETPTVNGTLASDVYVNSSIPTNTSGATITVDWNLGNIQTLTLNQVGTTVNFTNPTAGYGRFAIFVKQDATGSRTVTTWDTDIKWPGGSAPVLSTAANAADIVSCIWDGTNYYCQIGLDFD